MGYKDSKQTAGSCVASNSSCCTEEMLKIKKQYQDIVNKGRLVGANWAAKMLQHWMNGSGKDLIIKMDVLRRFEKITEGEDAIRHAMEEAKDKSERQIIQTLKDDKERKYYLHYHYKVTGMPWSELFYASGSSILTGRMVLKAKREDDVITMKGTLEFHWWDPYDWHAGLTAYIPGAGNIPDADAVKYENAGCARKFDMYSFWHQSFEDIYKIDDILWVDTENIKWGEVKEGRAPLDERESDDVWLWKNIEGVAPNGDSLPGLYVDAKSISTSNPPQRADRRERDREDTRRDRRRRR